AFPSTSLALPSLGPRRIRLLAVGLPCCSSVRTLALFLAECQAVHDTPEKRLWLIRLRVAQLQEGNTLPRPVRLLETLLYFLAVLDQRPTGEQAAFFRCYRVV